MNKLLARPVLVIVAMCMPVAAAETVPLDVVHIAPLADHQLVVYSVCSPEHCWHTFYIRKVEWSGVKPEVTCRKPVVELNEASDFIAESVARSAELGGSLDLHMVSSHGVFQPTVVTLAASGACRYKLGKLPAAAANNSFKPKPLRGSA